MGGPSHLSRDGEDGPGIDDPQYSLRQETTEFLTQLSQSLSDENDNLIGLVRGTLSILRELQGLPEGAQRPEEEQSEGQNSNGLEKSMVQALPTSYEALATDMDAVLENLRSLLSNPNFVSVDEVEARDEEIARLRCGWEKMEARWKEAIVMMEGWRKRIVKGGDTIRLEELKRGLGLGDGLPGIGSSDGPHEAIDEDDDAGITSEEDETGVAEEEMDATEEAALPTPEEDEDDDTPLLDGKPIPTLSPLKSPLKNGTNNANISPSPRRVTFARSGQSSSPLDENVSEVDLLKSQKTSPSPSKQPRSRSRSKNEPSSDKSQRRVCFSLSTIQHQQVKDPFIHFSSPILETYVDPVQAHKRLSSPSAPPEERSRKTSRSTSLTVQEKLNVAQAEAEAAAVAAGLRLEEVDGILESTDSVRKQKSPAKKSGISGRARRRKSTLSPEELEGLLGLN